MPRKKKQKQTFEKAVRDRTLRYVKGDATDPQGEGNKIIVHCCNDLGIWGAGFVLALSKKWPHVEMAYKEWHQENSSAHGKEIAVAPIRYDAIMQCLNNVGSFAQSKNATIHAPRFGAGLAGGDWDKIESIINNSCLLYTDVTIYDFE